MLTDEILARAYEFTDEQIALNDGTLLCPLLHYQQLRSIRVMLEKRQAAANRLAELDALLIPEVRWLASCDPALRAMLEPAAQTEPDAPPANQYQAVIDRLWDAMDMINGHEYADSDKISQLIRDLEADQTACIRCGGTGWYTVTDGHGDRQAQCPTCAARRGGEGVDAHSTIVDKSTT
jgi:hypothetical protein